MSLLDLQSMESEEQAHGGGHGSEVSLLLCDSVASVALCL